MAIFGSVVGSSRFAAQRGGTEVQRCCFSTLRGWLVGGGVYHGGRHRRAAELSSLPGKQDRGRTGDEFASPVSQVLVSLNCGAQVASATSAGNSVASPEGEAAAAAAASATPAPSG